MESALPVSQQIQHHTQSHTCAFILHGLNTHPAKMNALKEHLKTLSETTISMGVLAGHHPEEKTNENISASTWQNEFASQWSDAVSGCKEPSDRRIFVGYSLGALVALSLLDNNSKLLPPTHMILIAPALRLRKKVVLVKALSWLPFGALPSLNHREYRARNWTSFAAYDALFNLNNNWKKNPWGVSSLIPTVVFLAKDDELVDSQAIAEQVAGFPKWKTSWISNDESSLKPSYHHLMIDEESVGKTSWARMTQNIDELLDRHGQKIETHNKSGE